ncbi:MAG: hypothetical protein LBF83_01430 [Spirochaetaceae bacterium]|nr:hypothetical protein [Spirochaetaceae bacterium]
MENVVQISLSAISAVFSFIALILAYHIPHRVMVNQIYSDLVKEYRSPEMGGAILAIFRFYVKDCQNNVHAINEEYKKKYEKQINKPLEGDKSINYAGTLHFQRRLVAQFYYDMARLRYEERLPTKHLREWFTPREVTLLAIILHMVDASLGLFEEAHDVPEPPDMEDGVLLNKRIHKLYEEVEGWERK